MQGIPLPKSESWHFELFKLFCKPVKNNLPVLFENDLEVEMNKYRKFRHVFQHGYAFQLEWDTMYSGLQKFEMTFKLFSEKINSFIKEESQSPHN